MTPRIHRFAPPLLLLAATLAGCPDPAGLPRPAASGVSSGEPSGSASPGPNQPGGGFAGPAAPGAAFPVIQVGSIAGGEVGYQDGKGAAARFDHPEGLALDARGTLYVADSGNHAIRRVREDGTVDTWPGRSEEGEPGYADGAAGEALFDTPRGLAFDLDGNLYVADTGNRRIRKVTPDGDVTTVAGGGEGDEAADGTGDEAVFTAPTALAVNSDGNIFVVDGGALRVITPDGQVKTIAGATAGLAALAMGPDDVLYLLAMNGILRIDQNAKVAPVAKLDLDTPSALAIANGYFYVLDAGYSANRLLYVPSKGQPAAFVESAEPDFATGNGGPGGTARLARPRGLAFAPNGTLLVADTDNHRVRGVTAKAAPAPIASPRPGTQPGRPATPAPVPVPVPEPSDEDDTRTPTQSAHCSRIQYNPDGTSEVIYDVMCDDPYY